MIILCIGDIFAKSGRQVLRDLLPSLIEKYKADFVIVNGENAAAGRGITPRIADEMLELPIDILTSGNHIWQHKQLAKYLDAGKILRPHNAPQDRAGSGVGVYQSKNGAKVGVINLQGRVFMYEGDKIASPFRVAADVVEEMRKQTPIIIVDFHAEITSEKKALGYWLDGKVSCVYGTHTHVQTADEHILPNGTAYITDIGMTGPHESVIGARPEDAIRRFLSNGQDKKWKPADEGVELQGICVEVDEQTGRARLIERIQALA